MCDPLRIYPSLPEYTSLFNRCMCATLPESTPPSSNIPPFSTNSCVRPSQNPPLPPRIYLPFQPIYVCDPPRIYPSLNTPRFSTTICDPPIIHPYLPEYTPLFNNYNIMRPSHNPPLPPRIYLPFQPIYVCDPPRIYPSQNTPRFSTTICDPPIIHPYLPEYTPLFNNYNIMRPSQNLPLPPRIYLPFQPIYVCDPPRIYPSQNTPRFSTTICDPPIIHPYLPENTPLFNNYDIMRPSQNLPLPLRIYPIFNQVII